MTNYIFLDSGPLGLACKGQNNKKAERCRAWIAGLRAKGYLVIVPEITEYETRREFVRIQVERDERASAHHHSYGRQHERRW